MKAKLLLTMFVFSLLSPVHGFCDPVVTSVSPTCGWNEQNTNVTVSGSGFEPDALAWLRSRVPGDIVGGCNTPGVSYGIWVSGHYAYVADGHKGLQIIDVSVPANPTIIGSWEVDPDLVGGPDYLPTLMGIYVSGNYAYVTGYSATGGLWIVDVTDPTNPTLVGYNLTYVAFCSNVKVSGDYAYLSCGAFGGLVILNVSNPQNITLEGNSSPPGHFIRGVQLSGDHAYTAYYFGSDLDNGGLDVFNISDPSAPYLESTYNTGGFCFDIAVSGNYAYLPNQDHGLFVMDISDPSNPYIAGSNQSFYGSAGIDVTGGFAYIALYGGPSWGQLKIISITDPHNPTVIQSFNTGDFAFDVEVSGDYAYIANYYSGLTVMQLSAERYLAATTVSETEIAAIVPAGITPETFDLYIENPDGNTGSLDNTFTITDQITLANFSADPTSGNEPLEITFTDTSTGCIETWEWDFGDGETSTQEDPSYEYTNAGDYTVSLTVTGSGGEDTETKTDYIHVEEQPAPYISQISPLQQEPTVPYPYMASWLTSRLGYTVTNPRWGRVAIYGDNFGESQLPDDEVRIGDPLGPDVLNYNTDGDYYTVEDINDGIGLKIGVWGDTMVGVYLFPADGEIVPALYGPGNPGLGMMWLNKWLGLWVIKGSSGTPVASNVKPIKVLAPLPD